MFIKYFTQDFLVHNPFGMVPAFVSVKVFIQQQLTIFQASQQSPYAYQDGQWSL